MHTSISHLTGKEQNDLRHISKRLVEAITPEFIFCYGCRTMHSISRSCFLQTRRTEKYSSMYDIAIVLSNDMKVEDAAVRIFATNVIGNYANANIIVHRKSSAFGAIEEGNFFYSWLFRSAILIYSKSPMPQQQQIRHLPKSKAIMYPETVVQLQQLQVKAHSYLVTAKEYYKQKIYAQSLLMLKNAIDWSLKSLIYGCTGYLADDLDMESLFNFTRNFTSDAVNLFPQNTKEETRLFQLLVEATGIAHTNEFKNATAFELIILSDRANRLHQTSKNLIQKAKAILQLPDNLKFNDSNLLANDENQCNPISAGTVL
jgi:uncharacterized protein